MGPDAVVTDTPPADREEDGAHCDRDARRAQEDPEGVRLADDLLGSGFWNQVADPKVSKTETVFLSVRVRDR